MTVASGTSTPTSITVVATSSRVSPPAKRRHRRVLVRAPHAAMHEADARAEAFFEVGETILRRREVADFGFLDQRADPIDPLAFVDRAPDGIDHFLKP